MPTTVRVPVYRLIRNLVLVETEEPVSAEAFRKACAAFPGLQVKDNPAEQKNILCHYIHLIKMTVKSVVSVKIYTMIKA